MKRIDTTTFLSWDHNAMEKDNNKRPQSLSSGRDEARAHLARQIGRLLAHVWLQDHATTHTEGEPSADGVDGTDGLERGQAK